MKLFDAGETRMIGLPYGEKNYDDMLSRFRMVPERNRRTDLLYQYRASDFSMLRNIFSKFD